MQGLWLVTMNSQANIFNVYLSEARAHRAVQVMRDRLTDFDGQEATDHFDPQVIGKIAEGEAFGDDVCVEGKRQFDEVIL